MNEPQSPSPETEHQNHRYIGNQVPWYVHLLWISFWLFAITYALANVFPSIQKELLSPP
jgi:hypothetical protein